MDRLTAVDLARIRAEHAVDKWGFCPTCFKEDPPDVRCLPVEFPCDAARLLDHFAPAPVPHLAGIQVGLFGPSRTEELPR